MTFCTVREDLADQHPTQSTFHCTKRYATVQCMGVDGSLNLWEHWRWGVGRGTPSPRGRGLRGGTESSIFLTGNMGVVVHSNALCLWLPCAKQKGLGYNIQSLGSSCWSRSPVPTPLADCTNRHVLWYVTATTMSAANAAFANNNNNNNNKTKRVLCPFSILIILGRKCTLAASRAAPWWVWVTLSTRCELY